MEEVDLIQRNPLQFYERKERVCIRWDLDSSPWKCCPQSSGVSYGYRDGKLLPFENPGANASAEQRARLLTRQREAKQTMRMSAYDVCFEGAFFHAGLKPIGRLREPSCHTGTWALLDDIGRFSGNLRILHEDCAEMSGASAGG